MRGGWLGDWPTIVRGGVFLLSSLAGEAHPLLLFVLGRTTYAQVFGDDNFRINHFVFIFCWNAVE